MDPTTGPEVSGPSTKDCDRAMRTLLNIIWFLFAGIELFIAYVFFGVIACIFIVTIPAGVACFRMASYVVWPFGREVVDKPGAGAGSALMNVVWFLVAGLWLAIGHLMTAAAQAITIIGITTMVISIAGVVVGNFFGSRYKSKAEFIGGLILVLLGLKILLEHLGILVF